MSLIWKDHKSKILFIILLSVILLPSKFVYFNENLQWCPGRRYDPTCCRRKGYVTGGHRVM